MSKKCFFKFLLLYLLHGLTDGFTETVRKKLTIVVKEEYLLTHNKLEKKIDSYSSSSYRKLTNCSDSNK